MKVIRSALILVGCLVLLVGEVGGQSGYPELLSSPWKGMWITGKNQFSL